jgi:hypothetical protein
LPFIDKDYTNDMHRVLSMPLADALMRPEYTQAITAITACSYTNPDALLEQEFVKNNQIYLSVSEQDRVEAFFMVGWSTIRLQEEQFDCVFLGLSATNPELKGKGLVSPLYTRYFSDAQQRANTTARPVAWWFHTASPIVAGMMWRMMSDIGPAPDGAMSDTKLRLLEAIQAKFGFAPYRDSSIPYVLRNIAKARYGADEISRLAARNRRGSSLLTQLNICEEAGDRMLFVGQFYPAI